jgi:hypothetical protein
VRTKHYEKRKNKEKKEKKGGKMYLFAAIN